MGSQAGKYRFDRRCRRRRGGGCSVEQVIASFGDGSGPLTRFSFSQCWRRRHGRRRVFTRIRTAAGPISSSITTTARAAPMLVTSGAGGDLKTFFWLKSRPDVVPRASRPLGRLLRELEALLADDAIDVEFAIDRMADALSAAGAARCYQSGNVVWRTAGAIRRPRWLKLPARSNFSTGRIPICTAAAPSSASCRIGTPPRSSDCGRGRWRSRSTELITDAIWAYQRDNYGYKNLRSFPLMVSFHGLPYIDVRVSFNSFVPRDIDGDARRAAGQLLHRPAAGAARSARQGRVRDHLLLLHARSCPSVLRCCADTASRQTSSPCCPNRCGVSPTASSMARPACGGRTARRLIFLHGACRRSATPRSTRSAASTG